MIAQTQTHKGFLIVTRPGDGTVDAVDTTTGRWFNAPTVRSAKWSVSVFVRIRNDMADTPGAPVNRNADLLRNFDYKTTQPSGLAS